LKLAEKLKDELQKLNRLDWHEQSCENVSRLALLEKQGSLDRLADGHRYARRLDALEHAGRRL